MICLKREKSALKLPTRQVGSVWYDCKLFLIRLDMVITSAEEIATEDEVDMAELISLAMEILKERDRPLKVLGVELDNTLLVTILSLFGTLGGAVISGLMRFLL